MLIVDTAGRLHTQDDLMAELAKIRRVIAKQIPEAPHETLLTVDATTGQNGLRQARLFSEAIDVTGLALTKLDGTAKGGIALAIAHELGIPVKLIGVGEQLEDLRPFEPPSSPARSSPELTGALARAKLHELSWIVWVVVACAFGAGEMLTAGGFFLAPFAIGAAVGAAAAAAVGGSASRGRVRGRVDADAGAGAADRRART